VEETCERRSYLDEHFNSDISRALLGETHEIQINEGSQPEGMEAVQAARSKEGESKQ